LHLHITLTNYIKNYSYR